MSELEFPGEDKEGLEGRVEVRCYFVRQRNALVVRGEFEPIYVDHYLHLMQHEMRLEPQQDGMLKDALAAATLHLASRPWHEVTAWTVNFREPRMNLFVTGDSRLENVTGRVFTEGVREVERNLFYAQVLTPRDPVRKSVVEVDGTDFFRLAEEFYAQSEQRLARFFRYGEQDFVLVSAQPQCDEGWLEGLDDAAIRRMDEKEELRLLERRYYRFDCGCTVERIYPVLAAMGEADLEELFDGRESVEVTCPRCGARFEVMREGLDEFLAGSGEEEGED